MDDVGKDISLLLDELAVKIMMIEPGDLSAVGELLEILEKFDSMDGSGPQQTLVLMARGFKDALQKLIMAEIPDSRESYDQLAECVSRMQEIARDGDDRAILEAFCTHLNTIGCDIDCGKLFNWHDASVGAEEESESVFLKDRELLECFIDESGEYLGSIEAQVLELEKDPGNSEAVNTIFRAFHTIKGTSDSVSLFDISKLAHATESVLDLVRSERIAMDGDVIETVLGVADTLQSMIAHVQDVFENEVPYRPSDTEAQLDAINRLMEKKKGSLSEDEKEEAKQSEDLPAIEAEEVPGAEGQGAPPDFLQDVDLLSGFISEAFEHLEAIELNVLELEQNPEDLEIINNIFRPFHTIKGVSGFLNLTTINKLAHATENLLDDVRNGKLTMSSDIIDIVLGVGDFLRTMIQNVSDVLEKGPQVFQHFDISEFLTRIQLSQQGTPVPASESREQMTEEIETQPSQAAVQSAASVEVRAESVSAIGARKVGNGGGAPPPARKKRLEAAIKVDVNKLDGLVNAVGELVIMQAMVRHNPLIAGLSDPKLNKDFSQLTRITTELQKTAMAMRMVPIRQTFQKMTRLVRDLSKKTGKKVDLVMEGEETEIDRNMVDSIYDPLVHMIRNSVDHGVQAPGERLKSGKPEAGTVKLSAYQKGGNIIIEIADDGEGVNTAKIRQKALERGLIQEDADLSDFEINNLIFLPGFSTADKITDVSGRGVGMDVVKKGVEKLRGKVELQSTPGVGSLFLMYLPLTLAIIDGIVVRVGAERYIIPTIAIRESMRPNIEHYNTVHGRGETMLVRDSLIPIIRLYKVFGVEDACTNIEEGIAVVVENEGRQRALLVDELLGKQEVVIKSLGGYMKDVKGVAGGTILGDGRVGLILDLAGLINVSEELAAETV